ncbi:hypothetical protein OFD71_39480, partial [Escherichia coli]|nr:hypothetical protein [Escherichia coli]
MSSRNLSELINTTLLIHSEKLSNLDRDMLAGLLDQLNREQALTDKQINLCQRLIQKTNQACVFID